MPAGQATVGQPGGELRGRAQPEEVPHPDRVIDARHPPAGHLAGPGRLPGHGMAGGYARRVVAAGGGQQHQQIVTGVPAVVGPPGTEDVAAHRQAQQFADKVILQPGPDDLSRVGQMVHPAESDHGIHQKRIEGAGNPVCPGGNCELVQTVMCLQRERAALPDREIRHLVADEVTGPVTVMLENGPPAGVQQTQVHPEGPVRAFRPPEPAEQQVEGRTRLHGGELGDEPPENAGLGRYLELPDERAEPTQGPLHLRGRLHRRVHLEHGVAAAGHQAVQRRQQDTFKIVQRMVQADMHAEHTGLTHGASATGDRPQRFRGNDQFPVTHDSGDRRGHLRRYSAGQPGMPPHGKVRPQYQIAELTDGQGRQGAEALRVMDSDDQVGDGIVDQRCRDDLRQPDVGERLLGRQPFGRRVRREARHPVAGLLLTRPGEQFHQIREHVPLTMHDRMETHGPPSLCRPRVAATTPGFGSIARPLMVDDDCRTPKR